MIIGVGIGIPFNAPKRSKQGLLPAMAWASALAPAVNPVRNTSIAAVVVESTADALAPTVSPSMVPSISVPVTNADATALAPTVTPTGGSTHYLALDATDDNLKIANNITITKAVYDVLLYSVANGTDNTGRLIDNRISTYQIRDTGFTFTPAGTTGEALGTRTTLTFSVTQFTGTNITLLSHNTTAGYYAVKADVYNIKLYNGETLVAHLDMNTQTVQDQSGNGNHATLIGGTWV